ncbi:MAG TPA: hypothetical protein VF984_05710 [Actinomycetota bacterium]
MSAPAHVVTPSRGSNRGFWTVTIPIGLACVLLLTLILLNRPIAERASEVTARQNLRRAVDAAVRIQTQEGTLAVATKQRLKTTESDLLFIDPDEASNDPGIISVFTSGSVWAAANRADTGTCYWVRLDHQGSTTFGTGADCTGDAARAASDPAWPSN